MGPNADCTGSLIVRKVGGDSIQYMVTSVIVAGLQNVFPAAIV